MSDHFWLIITEWRDNADCSACQSCPSYWDRAHSWVNWRLIVEPSCDLFIYYFTYLFIYLLRAHLWVNWRLIVTPSCDLFQSRVWLFTKVAESLFVSPPMINCNAVWFIPVQPPILFSSTKYFPYPNRYFFGTNFFWFQFRDFFTKTPFVSQLKIDCNAVWFIPVQPPKAALQPSTSSHWSEDLSSQLKTCCRTGIVFHQVNFEESRSKLVALRNWQIVLQIRQTVYLALSLSVYHKQFILHSLEEWWHITHPSWATCSIYQFHSSRFNPPYPNQRQQFILPSPLWKIGDTP